MNFDIFDSPHLLELITVTRGYRDQTTGDWVDEQETTTTITGSFDRGSTDEDDHTPGGTIEGGDARIFTAASIKKEDRVRVHLDDSGTNFLTYRVTGLKQDYSWLEQYVTPTGRNEWLLELERADL